MATAARDLRPGVDRFPRRCTACGSPMLTYEPPLAKSRFGVVTCTPCGAVVAYVKAPRRSSVSLAAAALTWPREPEVVVDDGAWRLDGCGPTCLKGRHDPFAHEAYGRRRAQAEAAASMREPLVRTGPLTVDYTERDVFVGERRAKLTPVEFGIVGRLARSLGALVTQTELVCEVWGTVDEGLDVYGRFGARRDGHLLRVNIARLRPKLGAGASLLRTILHAGYVLDAQPIEGADGE